MVEHIVDTSAQQGAVDPETWRFLVLCLGDDREIIRSLGVLALTGLSEAGTIDRGVALAILEPVVINGGEFARDWFRHYARILGVPVSTKFDSELRGLQQDMGRHLTSEADQLIGAILSDADPAVRRSCAPFLIIAGIRYNERHVIVGHLVNQLEMAEDDDDVRFWTVALAAVLGGYTSEYPGPYGYINK